MLTKKIEPIPPFPDNYSGMPCFHREHYPPSMMVFKPGTYEHTCPACGHVTIFTVQRSYC
jgi:hypothetical protein